MDKSATSSKDSSGYTVVARRYRPRSFGELIGQDHIAQALNTAIETGRVGHAYLFTGARGVGKTSSARIFAKALNSSDGVDPELAADLAQAIDAGEDMDVIEIDGASNRGIEEIRQLRANVSVRPSRSRYKIYIIDEVHMLTNQAFNALLKTLEEPPPHVKFIFCTTDPDKLPITVLSRCQRFDFVPIKLDAIQTRLKEICQAEGFTADDDALALLARRAAGSMRDSQSLLEQVMSFAQGQISVEQVQQLLGIADEGRLLALAETLAANDALHALELVDEAARSGADAGQLTEQLLNYFRDLMAVGVGGGPELLKLANPAGHAKLAEIAQRWGVSSILAAIQILDESLVRMRSSVSGSALLEVALVQICQLSDLASIPALLNALRDPGATRSGASPQGQSAGGAHDRSESEKKNARPEPLANSAIPTRTSSTGSSSTGSSSTGSSSTGSGSPSPTPPSPAAHLPVAATADRPQSPTAQSPTAQSPTAQSPTAQPTTAQPPTAQPSTAQPSATQSSTARPPATQPPTTQPPTTQPLATPTGTSSVAGSADALQQWRTAVAAIGDMLADYAGLAVAVAPQGSDRWNVVFPPGAARSREICEQSERRQVLEKAVAQVVNRSIRLTFSVLPGEAPRPVAATQPSTSRVQKMREVSENPFVKKLCEVLDGEILRVDPPAPNSPQFGKPGSASSQSSA